MDAQVTNTDRAQLAALKVADVALEQVEGAASVALYALAKKLGIPEPVSTIAVQAAMREFHVAHKRLTVPTVTAPGLVSNLPEV